MNRRLPLSAFLLASLCITFTVCSAEGQSLQYQHGHLLNIPVLFDSDGLPIWSTTHAFLAVRLESAPETTTCVEYVQQVDYLDLGGGEVLKGGAISRCVLTSQATHDGWILLPLSKPCSPGETSTDVGRVTVCPPRKAGDPLDACTVASTGVVPIFDGVPPEMVTCGAVKKKRAVRS